MLDIVGQDAMGNSTISLTSNGVIGLHANLQEFIDDVTVNALYATDSLDITDSRTLEAGVRFHRVTTRASIAQTTTINLGDPSIVADDSVSVFSGQTTSYEFRRSEWVYSVGANYIFSQNVSAFAHCGNSFGYTPEFQQWFNCCTDVDADIDLVEGGVKGLKSCSKIPWVASAQPLRNLVRNLILSRSQGCADPLSVKYPGRFPR